MVCYYGRQVCKTGLSTNQPGLKMSGIGGFGGSKGAIRRYISRRVVSNLKPCGAISRHGVITGFRNTRSVKRASKCASIAGGVGRISNPRFSCGKPKVPQLGKIESAIKTLEAYFRKNNLYVALFAKKETLISDGVHESGFLPITHYFPGTDAYEGTNGYPSLPPHIIQAMDLINNQNYLAQLTKNGEFKEHVVATLTEAEMNALLLNNFGMPLKVDNYYTFTFGMTKKEECVAAGVALGIACLGAGVETLGIACVIAGGAVSYWCS